MVPTGISDLRRMKLCVQRPSKTESDRWVRVRLKRGQRRSHGHSKRKWLYDFPRHAPVLRKTSNRPFARCAAQGASLTRKRSFAPDMTTP